MTIPYKAKTLDMMQLILDTELRRAETMVVYVDDKEVSRTPVKFENGCFINLESLTIDDLIISRYEIINKSGDVLIAGDEWHPLVIGNSINMEHQQITPSVTLTIN